MVYSAGRRPGARQSFRIAPDGFDNHTKNGSVFGKTVKTSSAGSLAFGVLYAKGGGYRPTVIPTTNVGLVNPTTGINFSQPGCGFLFALCRTPLITSTTPMKCL